MSIGQRVRPFCRRHACGLLRGTIDDIRTGNYWKYRVKWDDGTTGWMTERGLEVLRERKP